MRLLERRERARTRAVTVEPDFEFHKSIETNSNKLVIGGEIVLPFRNLANDCQIVNFVEFGEMSD